MYSHKISEVLQNTIKYGLLNLFVVAQVFSPTLRAADFFDDKLAQLQIEPAITTLDIKPDDGLDLDPPDVNHIPINSGVAGSAQSFSVRAVDAQGIAEVTFFYRAFNQDAYQSLEMRNVAGTDNYTVSVQTTESQKQFEYYFLVVDTGGNKVLNGFPYQPFERFLVQPTTADSANPKETPAEDVTNAEQADQTDKPAGPGVNSNHLLWGLLGLVVIGALASSGGGDQSTGSNGQTVPVTVRVPLPR